MRQQSKIAECYKNLRIWSNKITRKMLFCKSNKDKIEVIRDMQVFRVLSLSQLGIETVVFSN